MSPDEIKHFLISLDLSTGKSAVKEFGTDYDAAQTAYGEAERADVDSKFNIVLISADSLETIEKTHSSYFMSAPNQLKQLLADAVPR